METDHSASSADGAPALKEVGGIWLPAGEEHLVDWMQKVNRVVDGKLTYQYHKLERALSFCREDRRRVAVDVGAHVGLWTMHLSKVFEFVHAFEPNATLRECFDRNVQRANVMLIHAALGETEGKCSLVEYEANSGHSMNTGVKEDGDIRMLTLDSFNFPVVDFIKIDVEGFEPAVIKGAAETIKRCRPVIIVEQKNFEGHHGFKSGDAVRLLTKLGMVERFNHGGDHLMEFPR